MGWGITQNNNRTLCYNIMTKWGMSFELFIELQNSNISSAILLVFPLHTEITAKVKTSS